MDVMETLVERFGRVTFEDLPENVVLITKNRLATRLV